MGDKTKFRGDLAIQRPTAAFFQVACIRPLATCMCAGKATALAQSMRDRGCVYALDRTHSKVADIVSLADELGITCIRAHQLDATKACTQPAASEDRRQAGVLLFNTSVAESPRSQSEYDKIRPTPASLVAPL